MNGQESDSFDTIPDSRSLYDIVDCFGASLARPIDSPKADLLGNVIGQLFTGQYVIIECCTSSTAYGAAESGCGSRSNKRR